MDTTIATPTCPHCGFTIFNRRFPNCERCKQALPQGSVLSQEERLALQAREQEEEMQQQLLEMQKATRRGKTSDSSGFDTSSIHFS